MGVSLSNWRVRIGLFNCKSVKIKCHSPASTNISNDLLLIIRFLKLCNSIAFLFLSTLFFVSYLALQSRSTFFLYYIFSKFTLSECISHSISLPAYILKFNKKLSKGAALACTIPNACLIAATINSMLLLLAGIEKNPGPRPDGKLSFATWNVGSLLA